MVLDISGCFVSGRLSGKNWKIVNVNCGSSYRLEIPELGLLVNAVSWCELFEFIYFLQEKECL